MIFSPPLTLRPTTDQIYIKELYAGPNMDLRALLEGISLDSQFGTEVYVITGHSPPFLFAPAKSRWFKANRPEI